MLVHHNRVEGPEMKELLQNYDKVRIDLMLLRLRVPAAISASALRTERKYVSVRLQQKSCCETLTIQPATGCFKKSVRLVSSNINSAEPNAAITW